MKCLWFHTRIHIDDDGKMSINDETMESRFQNQITDSEREERRFSIEKVRRQLSLQFRKIRQKRAEELQHSDAAHPTYIIQLRKISRNVSQRFLRLMILKTESS